MVIPPLYILVRIWIHRGLETEFEAYESKVSRIMARYGGIIERAIRTSEPPPEGSNEPFEAYVIKFPSREHYDAYQNDTERRSLSGERMRMVTNSDVLVGTLGPAYGP
jgi:uncharacterized protein (DUF1330 family)